MAIRFFVDESDLALGKALAATHPEVVYPGHQDWWKSREVASMTNGCRLSAAGTGGHNP